MSGRKRISLRSVGGLTITGTVDTQGWSPGTQDHGRSHRMELPHKDMAASASQCGTSFLLPTLLAWMPLHSRWCSLPPEGTGHWPSLFASLTPASSRQNPGPLPECWLRGELRKQVSGLSASIVGGGLWLSPRLWRWGSQPQEEGPRTRKLKEWIVSQGPTG